MDALVKAKEETEISLEESNKARGLLQQAVHKKEGELNREQKRRERIEKDFQETTNKLQARVRKCCNNNILALVCRSTDMCLFFPVSKVTEQNELNRQILVSHQQVGYLEQQLNEVGHLGPCPFVQPPSLLILGPSQHVSGSGNYGEVSAGL